MSDTFAPMIVIPVYEHERAIGPLLQRLLPHGVPVLLVDDGSGERCAAVLRELAAATPSRVTLLRLDANQGKGGAVIAIMIAVILMLAPVSASILVPSAVACVTILSMMARCSS